MIELTQEQAVGLVETLKKVIEGEAERLEVLVALGFLESLLDTYEEFGENA